MGAIYMTTTTPEAPAEAPPAEPTTPPEPPAKPETPPADPPSDPAPAEDHWKRQSRENENAKKKALEEIERLKAELDAARAGSAEADKLKADLAEKDKALLQHQVAAALGSPALAGRLHGATEEEMLADGQKLLSAFANPLQGGTARGTTTKTGDSVAARQAAVDRMLRMP